MVRKSWALEVMSRMSRIIEGKNDTLEIELSLAMLRLKMDVHQKLMLKSPNQVVQQM